MMVVANGRGQRAQLTVQAICCRCIVLLLLLMLLLYCTARRRCDGVQNGVGMTAVVVVVHHQIVGVVRV